MGPGGEQYGEAPESPPARAHDAEISVHVDPLRFGQQELRAEMQGLTAHGFGERMAFGLFQFTTSAVIVICPPKVSFSTTSTLYRARAR